MRNADARDGSGLVPISRARLLARLDSRPPMSLDDMVKDGQPVASTSKLADRQDEPDEALLDEPNSRVSDVHVPTQLAHAPAQACYVHVCSHSQANKVSSPSSSKGKAKAEDRTHPPSMDLDEKESVTFDDTEDNEQGDPEEEILMTVNGLKYSGGIRTREQHSQIHVASSNMSVS